MFGSHTLKSVFISLNILQEVRNLCCLPNIVKLIYLSRWDGQDTLHNVTVTYLHVCGGFGISHILRFEFRKQGKVMYEN